MLKGFLESVNTLEENQIEGILEAASILFEAEYCMDPVGEEDEDVNNDGEVNDEDEYLKNKREKISGKIKEGDGMVAEAEGEEKSFTPKKTPGIDKLIAALGEKVKQEGNADLAKLLAIASKEKKQLLAESEDGKLWAKDAHPDEGKMHRMLDIPKGKKVTDVYTSGKSLAKDLLKANKGDKRKTAGMLGFVANVNKGTSVFDKAMKALPELKGNKD